MKVSLALLLATSLHHCVSGKSVVEVDVKEGGSQAAWGPLETLAADRIAKLNKEFDEKHKLEDEKKEASEREAVRPITSVKWTKDKDPLLPKGEKQAVAFRDMVVERTGQRIFDRFMYRVKHQRMYGRNILRDPIFLREGINVDKKSSLYDIKLVADHMMIHGFHNLKLTYIRVIRHFGVSIHISRGLDQVAE